MSQEVERHEPRVPVNRIRLGRDYAAEIRAIIEDMTNGEESWVAGIIAAKLAARLRETDPELLQGWLDRGAETFLKQSILSRDAAHRTHNRQTANRQALRSAVEAAEQGDKRPLYDFLDNVYEVEGGARRRLRDMNRGDLRFAAAKYRRRAAENTFVGKFLEALATKVGEDKVSDHFTEEELAKMWGSLGSL